MKKENKLKLNDFNIDNIDTIKNKYKYFLISNLFDLEKSNHNNYKINLNSLAIRHPNRKYLQTYIDRNFINQNFIIDDFIENEPKIKRMKKFDKKAIDLSKNKNNILNFESENLGLNQLVLMSDTTYYLDSGTYVHLSYGGYGDVTININIDFNTEIEILMGDANLNQVVNVADIVLFVNFLFNQVAFNQIQLDSTDINFDQEWNVVDIVNIVNLIFT